MIEKLSESVANILGFEATGRLIDDDYRNVLVPDIEAAVKEYGKVKCLIYLPRDFEGWTCKAMWDDFKLGVGKHRYDFEKLCVVGGPKWIEPVLEISSHFDKTDMKVFPVDNLAEAWSWIKS